MATSANPPFAQARPPHTAGPIERYFEVSLFLMVATGFLALVGTGRLDALSLIVVSLALVGRAFLLLRRAETVIPERWDTYLTFAYVLFYALDFFTISGSFVTASVHLVLFSMVVKIFSVRRNRDFLYLAILSFLEVLASAVLTVDTMFLAWFALFLLLTITTFVSFEMKRAAEADPHRATAPRVPSRVMRALTAAGVLLMAAILAGSTVLFFLIPRLSAGYLSSFAPRNEFSSGFSDHVQLGEIGQIKQTDNVIMHVQIDGDTEGQNTELKWRGVALSNFDGKVWSNPASEDAEIIAGYGTRYDLLGAEIRRHNLNPYVNDYRLAKPLAYRVVMEPISTSVLFLASVPWQFQGNVRQISVDENGAVFNADRNRLAESYRAYSLLPQPSLDEARAATGEIPRDLALLDLQLPPRMDPRVKDLSEQITSQAATPYDKAVAIELYLSKNYGYTTFLGSTPPEDPIAYFLFERKEGHCEYFASAMAVMLRTVGIPSRVVNGFRGAQFNDLTDTYIVRGRQAHSWVEAYIPGYQWVTFDPTPPDPRPVVTQWSRMGLYLDAAKEFWREWVINYDFLHQRTLGTAAAVGSKRVAFDFRQWIRRQYVMLLLKAFRMHRNLVREPWKWGSEAVGGALAICLLILSPTLWRSLRRNRVARNPQRAPQQAASIWYARLTRTLARRGVRKRPSQTAQEFAQEIEDEVLRGPVRVFTEHYERARFGESVEDAGKLPQLYEEVVGRR